MKLSEQEKAAHKAAFRAMSPGKKLEHIGLYYKWPILLTLIALLVLGSVLQRELTKKEPVLYLAVMNTTVGSELETRLTEGFLSASGADAGRQEVYLYRDLYLSENADELNHEYAYASQMKLVGAIHAQRMDLVLMNREAYDIVSHKGYLAELPALAEGDPALFTPLAPLLIENEVILSDNAIELMLGEADEAERITRSVPNALAVSTLPVFEQAGLDGEVYLGLVANSPRVDAALQYIRYLTDSTAALP